MKKYHLIFILLVFSFVKNYSFSQKTNSRLIASNSKKTKSWLINENGERISSKYFRIYDLYIPIQDSLSTSINSYFIYSGDKKNKGQFGLLRGDGKIMTQDTLIGEFRMISPNLICLISDNKAIVFNSDGKINEAYSKNLYYYEDGALIKMKNNLFAVFNSENIQLSDYIYTNFDTGDFTNRNPPVLVYMETLNNEIHAFGLDGKIIK